MNRRAFLSSAAAGLAAAALAPRSSATSVRPNNRRRPCILLRGSWQSVNIGDIGHTPGALEVIVRHCPEASVILWPGWPGGLERGSEELLRKAFPDLRIVRGEMGPEGKPTPPLDSNGRPAWPELAAAWEEADILIHGSGSGFAARAQLAAWHRATGKPYGVLGVSVDPISGFGEGRDPEGGTLASLRTRIEKLPRGHLDEETRWILDHAAFFYARDTLSRDYLRMQGVDTPILEFGPDSQFGMTLRDDERGDAYRAEHGLERGKYLCVIPRLRYTPYYKVYNRPRDTTDPVRDAINERSMEADHAAMLEVIIRYVRETGHRVMTCPEMTYQIEVARTAVIDRLPEDVKPHVVWRDRYWLPDEAASIYANAQAVVSLDCHSPIIAITHGTPGIYLRQPTDTCKGQMYRDLGLHDWFFEVEETSGAALWSRLSSVLRDPASARAYGEAAMARVRRAQGRMIAALHETVT